MNSAWKSTGTIGFGMDFSDSQIGATLTFENHPGDLFYGGIGGMGGIAVVGILAAIAVPAYQDYTVRAKVAAAMTETAMARLTIAEFYASSGRLPNAEETAELELGATGDNLVDLYYDSRTLRLVATLQPTRRWVSSPSWNWYRYSRAAQSPAGAAPAPPSKENTFRLRVDRKPSHRSAPHSGADQAGSVDQICLQYRGIALQTEVTVVVAVSRCLTSNPRAVNAANGCSSRWNTQLGRSMT